MKFSTTFNFAERKGIVKKIEELVNPCANSLDVRAEISFEISVDELKELYRDRNEVDASSSDVSSFIDQMKKIWTALKNFIHDLLKEIVETEDGLYDAQNAVLRLRKNARENQSEFRKFSRQLDKEEAAEEEKTED